MDMSDWMKYELRNFPLKRKEFDEKMSFAEKNLFSLGLKDVSEEIGKENAKWFIANIHSIQEKLGYEKKAMVVGAPNFSFQTSSNKFRKGIPEGASFKWGNNTYDLVLPDLELDFCGMLVGIVEDNLSFERILDILYEMREKRYEIDNKEIERSYFWPGSHFLKLYDVESNKTLDLPKNVAVLHTSSNKMRNQLKNFARERAEEIETPFGTTHVLLGKDAREYQKCCKYASDFSKRKRQIIFKEIFDGETIANHNHCDLKGLNEAIIGCDVVEEGEISVISLTNRAYLVKGKKNLSSQTIEECFGSRSIEEWAYDYLLNLNMVSHGGGHELPGVDRLEKVIFYPEGRVFVLKCGYRTKAYRDMWNIPRDYRVEGILERIQSLGLASHYATLQLIYTIKVDF
jgi:hypothetical protein